MFPRSRRDHAANEPWVTHEPENVHVPEGLNRSERDAWSRMKKRRTAILRKIVVLLGKQIYGAPLKRLSTAVLEELINEAEELTDDWEEVAMENLPPRPTTKLQRLLANHWEIREDMMGIIDAACERATFRWR
jgi:hypothetical protein